MLTSPAVATGGLLPKTYTCDGPGVSPPLAWNGAPRGTRSFAVLMDSHAPDEIHWYWIGYDIPAETRALPEANQAIGKAAGNSVNRQLAYAPPCSKGPGLKAYAITLFALDEVPGGAALPRMTRSDFLKRIDGHVLAQSTLNFGYSR
ncbi:MAG: YbhB/YbcL family Raf kinase inhibitor-like protein [Bauldia sp.]